jgi:uncharacterized protein YejL (UPF0352 family)
LNNEAAALILGKHKTQIDESLQFIKNKITEIINSKNDSFWQNNHITQPISEKITGLKIQLNEIEKQQTEIMIMVQKNNTTNQ